MACVRQTDAWCHPGDSHAGTLCAPAGLVKRGDSGGSGNCGGREEQSGEGGHTQDLKTTMEKE